MSEIYFYGDSGNKQSALAAYNAAYRMNLDEAYQLIVEQSLKAMDDNDKLNLYQPRQCQSGLYPLNNQHFESISTVINPTIYQQLRRSISIDNHYYEQTKTTETQCIRCFISASLDEDQFLSIANNLTKHNLRHLLFLNSKAQA